jgi:hypothetical protein
MAVDERLSTACCANCGNTRIVYKTREDGEQEKVHLAVIFAVPADTPLDDVSIKKLGLMFSMEAVAAMLAERKKRGQDSGIRIIRPN